MSNYPILEQLQNSTFPADVSDTEPTPGTWKKIWAWMQNLAMTRPRATATSWRHPKNQAGCLLTETGDVEIRAGHVLYDHAIGASITLRPDGYVVLTAPAGVVLSGVQYNNQSPSRALVFGGGRFRFHPFWESGVTIATLMKGVDPTTYFVQDAAGNPVPLSQVFQFTPLYLTPNSSVQEAALINGNKGSFTVRESSPNTTNNTG